MRTQESISQSLVFAQESQKQVLRLNVRRSELTRLVSRKEDDAPCFLRITFEHITLPSWPSWGLVSRFSGGPQSSEILGPEFIMQSGCQQSPWPIRVVDKP